MNASVASGHTEMLHSFYSVLANGLIVILHKGGNIKKGTNKKKEIKLSLFGDELRWTMKGALIGNQHGICFFIFISLSLSLTYIY